MTATQMLVRPGATALALLAGGCASSQADLSMELKRSVEAYNHAYRWKNYERAASYRPPNVRAAFVAAYEDDEKSLHVEDFRVLDVKYQSERAATVSVRVTYTMLPSITVEKRTLRQHWHHVNGKWLLEREDNAIRDLDVEAEPANPAAQGRDVPAGDPATEVEVTGPSGEVLRKDSSDGSF